MTRWIVAAGAIALAFALALAPGLRPTPAASERQAASAEGVSFGLDDVTLREWRVDAPNRQAVSGTLTLDGEPVAGARVAVNGYRLPEPTGNDGGFTYPADPTVLRRHLVTVPDAADATIGGDPASADARERLESAESSFNVTYDVVDLEIEETEDGLRLSGRLAMEGDAPPPAPFLFAYRVRGTVTDGDGTPLADRAVVWRSPDFEMWTLDRTNEAGEYETFFWPSTETVAGGGFRVIVASGNEVWSPPEDFDGVRFDPLSSATVDIVLPASPDDPLELPARGEPEPGAYWSALLVGAMTADGPIEPSEGTWPDAEGRFSLVLPASLSGSALSLWTWDGTFFSEQEVEAGAAIEGAVWPSELPDRVPRGVMRNELP